VTAASVDNLISNYQAAVAAASPTSLAVR
jgi:hypothetical protein